MPSDAEQAFGAGVENDGQPFVAEDGRICQDKMEMMEDLEYDHEIRCKVQMVNTCDDANVDDDSSVDEEGQACHTMYSKECKTTYRPNMTKVMPLRELSSLDSLKNPFFFSFRYE